jgi:hypothetical protein
MKIGFRPDHLLDEVRRIGPVPGKTDLLDLHIIAVPAEIVIPEAVLETGPGVSAREQVRVGQKHGQPAFLQGPQDVAVSHLFHQEMSQALKAGLKLSAVSVTGKLGQLHDQDTEKILVPPGPFHFQVQKVEKGIPAQDPVRACSHGYGRF